ncbi:MAG: IS66 family insertion sequence element accessory protein TnpB [Aeromonas veronii]
MINPPAGTRIWIVAGITDMRNGFNGLASKVQMTLKDDPCSDVMDAPTQRGQFHT